MVLGDNKMAMTITEGKEVIVTSGSIASDVHEAKTDVDQGKNSPSPTTRDDDDRDEEKKLRVLIVDDQSFIRLVHRSMVNSLGMEAILAENGKVAVDLHHAGDSFDLILMDRDMPVMNGIEATKELRAMGVETNIVGVTAGEEGPEVQEFVEAGLNDCYPKPISVLQIAGIVKLIKENKNNKIMKAEKFPEN